VPVLLGTDVPELYKLLGRTDVPCMVQLNYNFTIPRVNLHGSPQCHGWLLSRGIRIPRLLTLHEHGTMQLFHALWLHVKHTALVEIQILKE